MSCGHDGCTCGPTTDTTTPLPTVQAGAPEPVQGCCGDRADDDGHECRHSHDGERT